MTTYSNFVSRRTILAAVSGAVVIAGVLAAATAQAQSTYDARFGTSSASSSHAVFYAKIADVFNKKVKNSRWTVVNTGGIVDNHALVDRKQIDVMASSSIESYAHYAGKGRYKDRVNKSLRTLFFRTPAPQNIIVRNDSGVKSIHDLHGKSFMAGARGTTTEKLTMRLLDSIGVKPKYFRGSLEDGVAAFQNSRIVGITKASPGLAPDATYSRLSLQTKISGLGWSDADIAEVKKVLPEISFIRIPKNTALPGNAEIRSLVLPLVIMTTTKMPDAIAYQVVKAAHESFPDIAKIYAGVRGVDLPKDTMVFATVPLHPGAARYYKELGISIPKNLMSPK
jgi:TRAP transporter TAXI family solute receptor